MKMILVRVPWEWPHKLACIQTTMKCGCSHCKTAINEDDAIHRRISTSPLTAPAALCWHTQGRGPNIGGDCPFRTKQKTQELEICLEQLSAQESYLKHVINAGSYQNSPGQCLIRSGLIVQHYPKHTENDFFPLVPHPERLDAVVLFSLKLSVQATFFYIQLI